MKEKDIPQDKIISKEKFTTDVYYVKNDANKYVSATSDGWEVKNDALRITWDDIHEKTAIALQEFKDGKKSPIHYYMIKNIMDLSIVSAYTGYWRMTIKRHIKPKNFAKLSEEKLQKYADTFKVTIEQLKTCEE